MSQSVHLVQGEGRVSGTGWWSEPSRRVPDRAKSTWGSTVQGRACVRKGFHLLVPFLNALGKPDAAAESLSACAVREPLGCFVGQEQERQGTVLAQEGQLPPGRAAEAEQLLERGQGECLGEDCLAKGCEGP